VAAVARDLGVGWQTVMRAVADHGRPLVDDPTRLEDVAALGLDETSSSRRRAWHPPDGSPAWSTWSAAGCWTW
jgi:transposase